MPWPILRGWSGQKAFRSPKTGDNKWEGDLLDAEADKICSGVATLDGPNALTLKGCIMGILCKGETWTRVK